MASNYQQPRPTDISKDFREFASHRNSTPNRLTAQKSKRPRPEMHKERLSDAIRNGGY